MECTKEIGVNVAPTSTEGHYVRDARNVVFLDTVTETFWVEGPCKLVTKNHTTLNVDDDCLISCQMVYDPFKDIIRRALD